MKLFCKNLAVVFGLLLMAAVAPLPAQNPPQREDAGPHPSPPEQALLALNHATLGSDFRCELVFCVRKIRALFAAR
jgi:hypothetical protein